MADYQQEINAKIETLNESAKDLRYVGFFKLLGLIFITLKLTELVDWSWWSVLLPLYPFMVSLVFHLINVIFVSIYGLVLIFKNK
jgi:hypothetical protein